MLGDSLRYIYGKLLGFDEGIKLGYTDGKLIGTILVMYMESHLECMLQQIWALHIDPFMVLMMSILRGC